MATKKNAAKRSPAQLAYDKRRAAAKKASAKSAKPATKKAATKRVVAKKASPLKGRKLGPRKQSEPETVVEQVQEDLTAGLSNQINAAEPSNEVQEERQDYFDQVDIIDLRGSDVRAIFALAVSLDARGFITWDTGCLVDPKNLDGLFHAEGVRLFHKNKLVQFVDETEISNSTAVSYPNVQIEASVELTKPEPMLPAVIQQNGATYIRVA